MVPYIPATCFTAGVQALELISHWHSVEAGTPLTKALGLRLDGKGHVESDSRPAGGCTLARRLPECPPLPPPEASPPVVILHRGHVRHTELGPTGTFERTKALNSRPEKTGLAVCPLQQSHTMLETRLEELRAPSAWHKSGQRVTGAMLSHPLPCSENPERGWPRGAHTSGGMWEHWSRYRCEQRGW